MGFHWPVISHIWTKSKILPLYKRTRVRENPCSRAFSTVQDLFQSVTKLKKDEKRNQMKINSEDMSI